MGHKLFDSVYFQERVCVPWQGVAQQQRSDAAMAAQALSAWRLYRLWAVWSGRAAAKAMKRARLSAVILHWRNRKLAITFRPWHAELMRAHDLEDLLTSFLGKPNCFLVTQDYQDYEILSQCQADLGHHATWTDARALLA